jgi:hypothetical protein
MKSVVALLVLARVASAQPALDDFYERTREREHGVGDRDRFIDLVLGIQTANPSTDALEPHVASGLRLGLDVGLRRKHDVVRTQLSADVLRVHETGDWFTDLGWHTTAFKAYGRPRDDEGMHLSLDSVVARRTEVTPSDVSELQLVGYDMIDVEGEVTPVGPMIDKDAHLALPIGVATRLRWADGGGFDLRTSGSVALAARALFPGLGHAQLDFVRVKHTEWDAAMTQASAWTVSTGYQRLPKGIDTLPIWLLVGYEWAGPKEGAVFQFGGAFELPEMSIGPSFERHFELDPVTGTFARVDTGRLAVHGQHDVLVWGVALESITIAGRGSLRAVTPQLGARYRGLALVAQLRAAWASDLMYPANRFSLGLDWTPGS